nr:hypothetical protein [Tanacetum cinerariifolium]
MTRRDTFRETRKVKPKVDQTIQVIPLGEIQVDDKLHFIKEPLEIMNREIKQLKQSHIPIVKGDQPLHVIAQVSLAGTAHNAPPTLKDLMFWTAEEKKTRKIDHLWDALERQMRDSEYEEQDRKVANLYEYETFKAIEGEQLLDAYLCYLQVINDLKKYGYKKDNCELNYKFLKNLQQEWKQYATLLRQTKNLMDINIDTLYNILKQNQGDVNDALGYKKKAVVITALLAKAFNRRKLYSKPTNNNLRTSSTSQFGNKKQEFVKTDNKKVVKKDDERHEQSQMLQLQEGRTFRKRLQESQKLLWIFVQDNMSRDVIMVGSTMRILLLYRGEYSQWRERFMNYLEEQTDGEAMINSIQNDPKFWTAEEKKTRKIDRLARSLLIQGLPNDIYSLIDSNKTAKDLWDALERQMHGSEYGEQDRKAAIFMIINDLKKCGYKKDNCELNYKFLNNLQQEWKQYATLMRQTKNLMDINIDALYNILKKNQGVVNDALGYKKKAVMVHLDPLALAAEKTN